MKGDLVMADYTLVSQDEWIEARKRLLAKEKEFTRLRDELNRERRELPWERVQKSYVFTARTAGRRWRTYSPGAIS
jgi:predicted dithiol-disulfide oxidoreductase (DUF899 family)